MSYDEMSKRYFETDHAKVYVQFRPIPPPELVQRVVDFLQEKYEGPIDQAMDLGCGSGQCTFAFAEKFSSVLGTDLSPAQIAEATESCSKLKCKNVQFQVSSAEKTPVADNSVQLITICEAAHWMDLPKVYDEAKRALCPNGVLAIIGYLFPPTYVPKNKEHQGKTEAIKKVVDSILQTTLDHLPKQALSVFREYSDITIPFSDLKRERGFTFTKNATLNDIEGPIRTYAPFKTICLKQGDAAGKELLDNIKKRVTEILNEGREKPMTMEEAEKYEFIETWNYFLVMARV